MNLLRKLLLAGATTASLLVSTLPAQAAPLPVTYTSGWSQTAVKPAWIRLGAGGSVMAHTWSWTTWNSVTAKSTGTLWVNGCVPNCANGKYSYHKINVTLSLIKSHNGQQYFSEMTWNTPGYHLGGFSAGNTAVMYYVTLPGGTIPDWTGCYPLSNSKTCYEPGEFCRNSDHGKHGLAGDGKFILCENKNGWRWE